MPQANGSQKTVEIHIFPSRCAAPVKVIAWDLQPGSTVTKAAGSISRMRW